MKHRSAIATVVALALVVGVVSIALASARKAAIRTGSVTPPTIEFSYYDSHIDAYIETDISNQRLATKEGINYSPVMAQEKAHMLPAQFEVRGRAADGQLTVFGSEPGEDSYTPFWDLVYIRWMPGTTPVLITVDDQVDQLEADGKISVTRTPIVTNAPIIGVDVTQP
ncbi:MAG: DUF7482 domain-containing protein [Actinomycetota bacterium]